MRYYSPITSLTELLGDEGLLRLPSHLTKTYVIDKFRKDAIESAINFIKQGKNVLIEGSPGTGKTALMFMILQSLIQNYKIGYIREGVTSLGNEHLNDGIILFYDDLPRMNKNALLSIIKNKVKGLIATARSEEISIIHRLYGVNIYEHFEAIKVPPLSDEKIKEMLLNYLDAEAIKIEDKEAIDEVVRKAKGLPVYVWQVIRELKIKRENLTLEYAKTIPMGMLDYIDNILWRILGGKEERYEALITLLTMTDFTKYSVHQDLYNYIYMVAKERRVKKPITIEDIAFDEVMEDISRYLAREGATYSFRLPHDSWADVLKGKSNGPMSPEISRMNILYKEDTRKSLIIEAARRAWHETVKNIDDSFRIDAFKNNIIINLGEATLKDIMEKPPVERPIPKERMETQPKDLEVVTVGDPLETLRLTLAKIKWAPKNMIAKKIGLSDKQLGELLDLSDFHIESKRRDYIYYKDHFLTALKKAEDIIQKYGKIDIKTLAEQVKLFPEDLEEHLKNKYLLYNGRMYSKDYIKNLIKKELTEKGEVDIKAIANKEELPISAFKKIEEKLQKTLIKSPYTEKYYTSEVIEKKIKHLEKILKENKKIEFEEVTKELDLPPEITKKTLKNIGEQSPTNPGIWYPKDHLNAIKNNLNPEKTLNEIAEENNVLLVDLEEIIKGTKEEKEYIKQRLKKLINNPNPKEMEELASKLEMHKLDKDEKNLLGVAYLIIWEQTKNKLYLEKATKILEETATKKAYMNLAIAYAKIKDYKKTKHYFKLAENKEV